MGRGQGTLSGGDLAVSLEHGTGAINSLVMLLLTDGLGSHNLGL